MIIIYKMNNFDLKSREIEEAVELVYNNKSIELLLSNLSEKLIKLVDLYLYFYAGDKSKRLFYSLLGNTDSYHGIGRFYKTVLNPTSKMLDDFDKLIRLKMTKNGNLRERLYVFFIINSNTCFSKESLEPLNNIPDLLWWLMEMIYIYDNINKEEDFNNKYSKFYRYLFMECGVDINNIRRRIEILINELGTNSFGDVLDIVYENVQVKDDKTGLRIKLLENKPSQSGLCYLMRPTVSFIYSFRDRMLPSRRESINRNTNYEAMLYDYELIKYPPLSAEQKEYLDSNGIKYWTLSSMTNTGNTQHAFTNIAKKYDKGAVAGISGSSIIMLDFFKIFSDINNSTINRKLLVAMLFYFMCYPYPGDHSPHEVFSSAEILSTLENEEYHWIEYDPTDSLIEIVRNLLSNTIIEKYTMKYKSYNNEENALEQIKTIFN
jgi:hypothetical protein